MSKSKIDWTDETINPFTGCSGPHGMRCPYCYAQRMATRLAGIPGPGGDKYRQAAEGYCGDPFGPTYHQTALWEMEHVLERRRKPRRVFIGSMGDMCFHGSMFCPETFNHHETEISTEELQKKIALFCTGLPQHTFQILTKRPDLLSVDVRWPSNVHLGVSVSRNADCQRSSMIAHKQSQGQELEQWDSDVIIWASVEPLLDADFNPRLLSYFGWVVIGAETGNRKGVDPLIVQAAKRIVEWCASGLAEKTPCFVKDNMRQADPDYDWPREFPK